VRFQPFSGGLFSGCDTRGPDATPHSLRACLQIELASFGFGDRDGGLYALGNHLSFLLCEGGVNVEREVVNVPAEHCNYEMHFVLHEPGYEVHVTRQSIKSRNDKWAPD
jgi:hypothetical protein